MAKQQSYLAKFGTIPLAAAAAGFVIAAALSIFVVQSMVNADHSQLLGDAQAQEIAQQINIREAQLKALTAQLASASIAQEAVGGSTAEIIEAEANLTAMIPYAERVRLIPFGNAKIDQGFPPFSYTALDLVKGTEAGESPDAEAISSQPQLEGDKWIIMASQIVARSGGIKGTLFVYFRAQALAENVTSAASGSVQILQQVGAAAKPIAVAGAGGSEAVFMKPLANPKWTIAFSPNPPVNMPGSMVFYLVPPLLMLVISIAGIFVAMTQIGAAVNTNLARLGNQISRVATGSYEDSDGYTLPGFHAQDSKLKQLVNAKPAPVQKTAAPPKKKPKAAADDAVVDIEMVDDPDTFEEVEELEVDDFDSAVAEANSPESSGDISSVAHIFRAYDIRGVVGESLSEDIARQVGLAVGSEAESRGEQTLLVGYDGREYSPALTEALIEGLLASGRDVINIGMVPTPVLYYGTHNSDARSGVMVTGSHNAPDYNGFKIVLDGKTLVDTDIQAIYERIANNDFSSGSGTLSELDITQDYMDAIADDVVVAQPLKVVIDCGNGVAGVIAPELLDSLGCETVPLYCEVDGTFPNHHPDPTKPANLEDLALTVQSQGADLGIALDGDGDRIVAVTAEGEIVWPDRLLMLFAKDIVSRNPGSDIVYDVKCTRHLNSVISGFGGRPIICRSGHSFVKEKVAETGALLGGELSGHICFTERWFGFDDGLYSAARLLEIVGSQEESLSDLLQEFPVSVSTPEIHIAVEDSAKFGLMDQLVSAADFEDASITTIDGLRVDFTDGWGLVRASNTEPALTLRFEADNDESLDDIKVSFRELIQEVRADLDFS